MALENTDIQVIEQIKKLVSNRGLNVVIVPHENPDGDAIGSAIGLAEVLSEYGHRVNIISPTDYPDFLKWFSSDLKILTFYSDKKKSEKLIEECDLLFCVDFNESRRVGKMEKTLIDCKRTKVLIDHHPFPSGFCDFTISETQYSSTAELIYDVLTLTGLKDQINKKSAEALYTGILTDTGSFSHNTSDPNTFKVVSELMKFGLDVQKIQSAVYHNFSADRMKLLGYCLNRKMVVFPEYRSAYISLTKKELEEYNFKTGDTEGFVNMPLSIGNIVFSAFFIERDGIIKASFRSKGNFPVHHFSKDHFGGGGHKNAAGGELKNTLEETVEKFTQLLPQYKHQLLETVI